MNKPSRTIFAVLFALLGIVMILQQLDRDFGWTGLRAPDVVYGDEESLLEGIALCVISILLRQGNRLTPKFALIASVGNVAVGILETAKVLDIWTLKPSFAFFWSGVWLFVWVVASSGWLQAHFKLQKKGSLS